MAPSPSETAMDEQSPVPGQVRVQRRRRRRKSELSRALASNCERIVVGLMLATVLLSAQAVGAVHTPVLLGVAVLGLGACALSYRARLVPSWRVPRPALILLFLSLYSFLQAVPLPMALLERVASASADVSQ